MTATALTQFLIDITRGHHKSGFATDKEHVFSTSMLDDNTHEAIRQQDIGALWLAGAHPMALMYFARACGWDNDQYYRCLADAEATRAVESVAVRPVDPAPPQTR